MASATVERSSDYRRRRFRPRDTVRGANASLLALTFDRKRPDKERGRERERERDLLCTAKLAGIQRRCRFSLPAASPSFFRSGYSSGGLTFRLNRKPPGRNVRKKVTAWHHAGVFACLFFGARLCSPWHCLCSFHRADGRVERVRIRRLFGLVQ